MWTNVIKLDKRTFLVILSSIAHYAIFSLSVGEFRGLQWEIRTWATYLSTGIIWSFLTLLLYDKLPEQDNG
jgi:hypothetical protein